MKKTITLSDGSTETMEGTAEEIAAYEKAKREQANESAKPKKRVLLKEEELRAMIAEELAKRPVYQFHSHCIGCSICRPYTAQPIWIEPQPWIEPLCPPIYIGGPGEGVTVTWDGKGQLPITLSSSGIVQINNGTTCEGGNILIPAGAPNKIESCISVFTVQN